MPPTLAAAWETRDPARLADATTAAFAGLARQAAYHVQATNFEHHALWRENSSSSLEPGRWATRDWTGRGRLGWSLVLGHLGGLPVGLDLTLDEIEGHIVLFYTSSSRAVDWSMIEHWFALHLPPPRDFDNRRCHSDAANFHHCLNHLAKLPRRVGPTAIHDAIVNGR